MLRRGGQGGGRGLDPPLVVALATGSTLTPVATVTPLLRFAYDNLSLHVALETAEGLTGVLLAYLAAQRYRARAFSRDAVLAWTFSILAGTNVMLSAVPMVTSGARPGGAMLWAVMGLRLAGAAGLCAAAFADVAAPPPDRVRHHLVVVTAGVAVLVAVGAGAAGAWLAEAVEAAPSPDASGRPRIEGHPVVLGLQLVAMVTFAAAAVGFRRQSRRSGEDVLRWLAAGAVLAAFARLSFFLYPSLYTNFVYTGDVLRLGSYAFFLAGAAHEIAAYREDATRLAVLEERRRMARDLHDGLVQELSFIRSQTSAAAAGLDVPGLADHVAAAADRALHESRQVVDALSAPPPGSAEDLLRVAAGEIAERAGARVEVSVDGVVSLPSHLRLALARIVREATGNAVRHGQAGTVSVRLEVAGEALRLAVSDDGKGFDPRTEPGRGFGLTSMRERAEQLGGRIEIRSEQGRGTTVEVSLPTRTRTRGGPSRQR